MENNSILDDRYASMCEKLAHVDCYDFRATGVEEKMKRLQVPIGDETIWEYDVQKVVDFALSKLTQPNFTVQFNGLDYPKTVDVAQIIRTELLSNPDKLLDVARQMSWDDLDPERDEVVRGPENRIVLADNWTLVKQDRIKVR